MENIQVTAENVYQSLQDINVLNSFTNQGTGQPGDILPFRKNDGEQNINTKIPRDDYEAPMQSQKYEAASNVEVNNYGIRGDMENESSKQKTIVALIVGFIFGTILTMLLVIIIKLFILDARISNLENNMENKTKDNEAIILRYLSN